MFWLVAYFWHFARPALAILLDPEIKEIVIYKPSKILNSCCPCLQDFEEEEGQEVLQRNNKLMIVAGDATPQDKFALDTSRVPLVSSGSIIKGKEVTVMNNSPTSVSVLEAEKLLLLEDQISLC